MLIKVLLGVLLGVVVLLIVLAKIILKMVFDVRYDENKNLYYKTSDDYQDLKRDDISFSSNQNTLRGSFYYVDDNYQDLVIFTHGLGAGHHSYLTEIHSIAQDGHLVFSYDNTGCAYSDGKKMVSFYQAVKDLQAALEFLKTTPYASLPKKAAGHSWGGYTAINSLVLSKDIEKVAVFAPLNSPAQTLCDVISANAGINVSFLKPFFKFWLYMIDKKEGLRTSSDVLANTNKPVLVIQGTNDQMASYNSSVVLDERVIANKNVTLSIKEGRFHNPYQSKRSEEYLNQTFAQINKLAASKKEEDKVALEKMYKGIDYNLITEEDEEIMKEFLAFLK